MYNIFLHDIGKLNIWNVWLMNDLSIMHTVNFLHIRIFRILRSHHGTNHVLQEYFHNL